MAATRSGWQLTGLRVPKKWQINVYVVWLGLALCSSRQFMASACNLPDKVREACTQFRLSIPSALFLFVRYPGLQNSATYQKTMHKSDLTYSDIDLFSVFRFAHNDSKTSDLHLLNHWNSRGKAERVPAPLTDISFYSLNIGSLCFCSVPDITGLMPKIMSLQCPSTPWTFEVFAFVQSWI